MLWSLLKRIILFEKTKKHTTLNFLGFKIKFRNKSLNKKLIKDNNFAIDKEFYEYFLKHQFVADYKITKLSLSEIFGKSQDGRLIKLKDAEPYKYLIGDKSLYENYLARVESSTGFKKFSEERYTKLIESLENKGYNNNNIIILNQDNCLVDGQHRACYLLHKHGEDYQLDVLKLEII